MIRRLFSGIFGLFGQKKEDEGGGDVIYNSLKMLLHDRVADCNGGLEIEPDEKGVCIYVRGFDEDGNAHYYVVDITVRLGGIMMLTGEHTVEIPLISGNKVIVSMFGRKVSIGVGKDERNMRFTEIDEGCVQVDRINRNFAEIKLIVGKPCTSYLSDGRSMSATVSLPWSGKNANLTADI